MRLLLRLEEQNTYVIDAGWKKGRRHGDLRLFNGVASWVRLRRYLESEGIRPTKKCADYDQQFPHFQWMDGRVRCRQPSKDILDSGFHRSAVWIDSTERHTDVDDEGRWRRWMSKGILRWLQADFLISFKENSLSLSPLDLNSRELRIEWHRQLQLGNNGTKEYSDRMRHRFSMGTPAVQPTPYRPLYNVQRLIKTWNRGRLWSYFFFRHDSKTNY